ncbi:MAG: sulfite exporter TauE/SafE family protein [Acidobacteria bacterium]|nr:sulfite exporter TauE/SafE family protein [Acidobacteriota bacterium]
MESILGFCIAMIVGLTGAGGGPLTVPLLVLLLGRSASESVGTSLAFVFVTKVFASPLYIFRKSVNWRVLGLMLAGGLPGVLLGSWILLHLSKKAIERILLPLVGVTIAGLAFLRLFRKKQAPRPNVERRWLIPLATLPIGAEVGFSSAGAGALGGLLLMYKTVLPTATIVGTDLLFGMALSFIGSGIHVIFGHVDQALVIKMLMGGIPGAIIGSWLGTKVPSQTLQVAMSLVFGYLGLHMSWKGLEPILMK